MTNGWRNGWRSDPEAICHTNFFQVGGINKFNIYIHDTAVVTRAIVLPVFLFMEAKMETETYKLQNIKKGTLNPTPAEHRYTLTANIVDPDQLASQEAN